MVTVDVTLRAPGGAVAGAYGGAVPDPAAGLARLLAGLHDRTGLVAVPGAWAGLRAQPPFVEADRRTRLPAVCVVTTLRAGTGSAAVPATACARLNVRTAPGQRTDRVAAALIGWLGAHRPPGVTLTVRRGPAVPPAQLRLACQGLEAASLACRIVFGRPPVAIRSGGTIAAVAYLQDVLGTPVVPLGFVPPGCRVHAAGERWPEEMLRQTAETVAWFLVAMAAGPRHERAAGAS